MTALSSDPAAQLLSANRAAGAPANAPTAAGQGRGEASGGSGFPAGGGSVPAGLAAHPASAIGPLSPGSVGGGVMPGHQVGCGGPNNTAGGGSQVAAGGGGNTYPAGGLPVPSGLGQITGGSPEAQPSTGYELVSRTS